MNDTDCPLCNSQQRAQPPLALSVPLPRFASRVGGGSAFYVRLNMSRLLLILVFVVVGILGLLLMYAVHCALDYCCVRHARRFCRRNDLEVCRSRAGMAFDQSGVKTEFTIVELDCLDGQKQRKLVRLLVWVFGIRKVLNDEKYPESFDEKWPQSRG
jgi:hypothetical protein